MSKYQQIKIQYVFSLIADFPNGTFYVQFKTQNENNLLLLKMYGVLLGLCHIFS